jgi:hypothetical protein
MTVDEPHDAAAIGFDLTQWFPTDPPMPGRWQSDNGATLTLRRQTQPFDVPLDTSDEELRDLFAPYVEQTGDRLIDVHWTWIAEVRSLSITTEGSLTPTGIGGKYYITKLMIPSGNACWSITITAQEGGVTGIRETIFVNRFLVRLSADQDPISSINDSMDRIRSEAMEERWDADFPDHPLSIVRAATSRVLRSITFNPDMPIAPLSDQ